MDHEFITIGEAARLLKQVDSAVMRLIKEALQAGIEREEIMKTEMRQGRMMYLVSKTFLLGEIEKDKEEPNGEEQSESEEELHEEESTEPAEKEEEGKSLDLLSAKNDMIATLQKVVDTKDQQIEDLSGKIDQLIERDHETNILLKGLQDRLFLLEQGNPQKPTESEKKKKK